MTKDTVDDSDLTDSQVRLFQSYISEAINHAVSTMPADKIRAEKAIDCLYGNAGLKKLLIVWTSNPFAGLVTYEILNQIFDIDEYPQEIKDFFWIDVKCSVDFKYAWSCVDEAYLNRSGRAVRNCVEGIADKITGSLDHWGTDEERDRDLEQRYQYIESSGEHAMHDIVNEILSEAQGLSWGLIKNRDWLSGKQVSPCDAETLTQDAFWESRWAGLRLKAWESLRELIFTISLGQDDAGVLARCVFLSDIGKLSGISAIQGLQDLSKSAGWMTAHADICFVSERHDRVHLDERGQLHCETGPALSYPGGLSSYA